MMIFLYSPSLFRPRGGRTSNGDTNVCTLAFIDLQKVLKTDKQTIAESFEKEPLILINNWDSKGLTLLENNIHTEFNFI